MSEPKQGNVSKKAEDFQSFNKYKFDGYNSYVLREWELFQTNGDRYGAFLAATADLTVRSVLDVGCGSGQEMLPFIDKGAVGFGLDYVPETGQVGRRMYKERNRDGRVAFVRGSGDALPLKDGSVDVVICRGAIMFMDNERALSEFSRVLSKGGRLFLMFQTPAYYWWKFRNGLIKGNLLSSVHAIRVLYAGMFFHITGRQPQGRLTAGGEVYETAKYVVSTCERYGLRKIGEMPDTNPQTPYLIFKKTPADATV